MTSRRSTFPALLAFLVVTTWSTAPAPAWAGTTVAIVKGKDVDRMVAEAIELLGGMKQFVRDGQKVVIKPNLVYQPALAGPKESRGKGPIQEEHTTDVRIVKALASQMLATAKCKIAVAEGSPYVLSELYDFLGYTAAAKELGIELVDTDKAERMTVKLDGGAREEYSLPVVTQTADVLVDVAAMKTHHLTGVTLGMKNLFGLVPMPKMAFHDPLSQVLCDLSLARKPDLVIIDGLVAMEGQGPLWGRPVEMDLLIAGTDIVAVDAVTAAVMGIEPERVKHLRLAHERGLGEIDLAKIEVKGLPIKAVRRGFEQPVADAEVRIARTDALVGKLVEMADQVSRDWRAADLVLTFRGGLKPDRKRHPSRWGRGFRVRVPPQGDEIVFCVPYRLLYEEEIPAAAGEAVQWIEDNLGKDARVLTDSPKGRPHL